MATAAIPEEALARAGEMEPAQETTCCVVAGGTGGMMLALLLARRGIDVTLLEAHQDFDRDFRGDTLHPSILEILDQIGPAEPLHQLPHNKIYGPTLQVAGGRFSPVDFRRLKTRFPYIMLIPQTKFLEFLAAQGKKYPVSRIELLPHMVKAGAAIDRRCRARDVSRWRCGHQLRRAGRGCGDECAHTATAKRSGLGRGSG